MRRPHLLLSFCLALIALVQLIGCGGGGSQSGGLDGSSGISTAGELATPTPVVSPTATATPHPPKSPVSLTVTPAAAGTIVSGTVVYHCTATFSDGTTSDVTASVTWTSSSPTVATVSNAAGSQGLAHGQAPGVTTITAAGSNLVAHATLTVKDTPPARLEVLPATSAVDVGETGQLQAWAVLPNGESYDVTREVVWTSDAPALVDVSNAEGSQGVVTGVAAGTATITAAGFGLTASAQVTASAPTVTAVEVEPQDLTLELGTGEPLSATAVMSDGTTVDVTTTATWTSSAPAIATVSAAGRVQSVAPGQAVVTATFGGVSGTTTVTVSAPTLTAIVVSPRDASIPAGTTVQLHATGIYSDHTQTDLTDDVTWSISPTAVATISAQGVATGVGQGSATVTATLDGVTGQAPLQVTAPTLLLIFVTPPDARIPVGYHQQYTATGYLSDGSTVDVTQQVTWSASPSHVLTISNQAGSRGRALAVGEGPATVVARLGDVFGSAAATGVRPVPTRLVVTPDNRTLCVGMRQQYTATVYMSDGTSFNATDDVHWNASDKHVVKISNGRPKRGRATAVGAGTALITADYRGLHDDASVNVVSVPLLIITVSPSSTNVGVGTRVQFTATATFLGVFTVDVTDDVLWLSSDTAVATISTLFEPGLAHTHRKGTTTIHAIFLLFFEGTAQLKVHP